MNRPNVDHQPDFARFRSTLLGEQSWRRPPLFDFHVADVHKARWLGRPIETPADDVAFWAAAGYDYVQAKFTLPVPELTAAVRAEASSAGAASTGGQRSIIESLEHYRSRRWAWQDVADGKFDTMQGYLDDARAMAEALPGNMKLLVHTADVFTFAWEMIGFDNICLASIEQPEFPAAVMDDLGAASVAVTKLAIDELGDAVGALLYSDDIAYTEGLMLGPTFYRERLFPWMAKLTNELSRIDAPMIYHSDGKLYDVFDDLAAIGVKAIQPLEPKSMDPLEIKRRWPGQFCLIGNVDLDLMARGTPEKVEAHVRDRIDTLNRDGGYIVGVSNTVPDYVQYDNYRCMIETAMSYPDEPI